MFSKASSSKSPFLSNSNHELPRWRSPSPMAASMIPPPIVQSTYASSPRTTTKSVIIEKPNPIQDRQSELEADLQFLLDAQAEGLVRGLEGGLEDDHTSTGSTTPTAQSMRSTSARRSAKPIRKRPGLRSSRKGIYNAILALSEVKEDELQGIDDDVQDKDKKLEQIEEWEKKKQGLQEATRSVDANEDTVRVQRLRQEADTLQEEISAVELQLADMKARHRKLVRQATAVDNSVQAKLASYNSSLRMLEDDIQKFLSFNPADASSSRTPQNGKASMWDLPPKRRTLQIARDHWNEEREAVVQQREGVQHEKAALDEGAEIWKDVVSQVSDFERRMRAEMSKQSSSLSQNGTTEDSSNTEASSRLRRLLDDMSQLTEVLESKFELAKSRNWNLLIAAIGAELDALKQGRQLLRSAVGAPEEPSGELMDASRDRAISSSSADEINELDKSFETARRRPSSSHDSDDPDPELLFSRPDPDTE